MKKIIYTLLLLVVLIIGLFIGFFDTISKGFAEQVASDKFKTQVVINNIDTDFLDKTATIEGIVVSNPQGYDSKNAFSLNKIHLEVDNEDELIIIRKLNFAGIFLQLEQKGKKINLYELYDNLDLKSDNKAQSKNDKPNNQKTSKTEDDIRVIINELSFTDMKVSINTKFGKSDIKVSDIIVRDFGKAENGIPVSQISQRIMDQVLTRIKKSVEKAGYDLAKDEIKKTFTKKMNDEVNKLKKQAEDLIDNEKVKKEMEKLKGKANDLLKGFGF